MFEATCLLSGYKFTYCALCGDFVSEEYVDPLGHSYDENDVCTVCGAAYGELVAHTPGAEATCTTAQTCTACGETLVVALGHDMGEWTDIGNDELQSECSRCDHSETKPNTEDENVDGGAWT